MIPADREDRTVTPVTPAARRDRAGITAGGDGRAPIPSAVLRPTRARYWVVVFAVALAIIQYVDRVSISKAMPFIQRDLHFTHVQAGYIFGAFTLAYALFEIPTGWLGDTFGPRKVLLRIVLWWSFFTAATAHASSAVAMMVVRFLFGAGEAGCFPNVTKAFSTWLRPDERVRAQGVLWLAARWGGAVTPLLVLGVLGVVSSWRRAFELFGGLGLVWAFFFYRWFRDNPHEHPSVNDAEKAMLTGVENLASRHAKVPWAVFFRSRCWRACRSSAAGSGASSPASSRTRSPGGLAASDARARASPRSASSRRRRACWPRTRPAATRSCSPCCSGSPASSTTSRSPARGARAWTSAGGSQAPFPVP